MDRNRLTISLLFTTLLLLPAYLSLAQYNLEVEFYSAEVNGVKISSPSQVIYVEPGGNVIGSLTVKVVNVRERKDWITAVIGTASWSRGFFSCLTSVAPEGESFQSFRFFLKAPETPGIYYIGVFAGWTYDWMRSCEEIVSNDRPPRFNDGDDVWDLSQKDWESMIFTGKAANYSYLGTAIKIIVSSILPKISVDVWTNKGGKGIGNIDGGSYDFGENAILHCSIDGDASYLKVWIEKPDKNMIILFENFSVKAGSYEFKIVMGEPEGEWKLKAVACPAGLSCSTEEILSRDEIRYYVKERKNNETFLHVGEIVNIPVISGLIVLMITLAALLLWRRRRVVSPQLHLPSEKSIEEEIKKYDEYLERLEELKNRDMISEKIYEKLKMEYEEKLDVLISKWRKKIS